MANELNFVLKHVPSAGLIAQPVDQQASVLPLSYGCPLVNHCNTFKDVYESSV